VSLIVIKILTHVLGRIIDEFHREISTTFFCFISSEKLIRTQAQLLVQGGYLAAGYEYIIIDDCWLNHTRAAVGVLFFFDFFFFLKNLIRMDHYNQIINDFQMEYEH